MVSVCFVYVSCFVNRKCSLCDVCNSQKEEKELEKSTTDLLSSTHRYLLDSPGNNRNKYFPALSSTVNNFESVKGIYMRDLWHVCYFVM